MKTAREQNLQPTEPATVVVLNSVSDLLLMVGVGCFFFSGAVVVVVVVVFWFVVYKFSASCCFNNYHVTSVMAFVCLLGYPKCIF